MCVVAAAIDCHPKYRLVLAANRDEFHSRPSAPLARWDGEDAHIIAGRDLQSGGTWLGVSEHGRIAVVTNIRTGLPPDEDKASRGALVSNFLRGDSGFAGLDNYNAFSLFAIDRKHGWFAANRPEAMVEPLGQGIHSLSNGLPADPWPRRETLHSALAGWLAANQPDPLTLFDVLTDETPLSGDDGHAPIFIRNPVYGTRCSTVVVVDRKGNGTIIERRFDSSGTISGQSNIAFHFQSQPPAQE